MGTPFGSKLLAAVLLDVIFPGQAGQARAVLGPHSVAGERASRVELPLRRHYTCPTDACKASWERLLCFLPCWSLRRWIVVTVGGSGD